MKEIRDRIGSVKNTQKITEAMKLVAAAKVRRAQAAVINGRPFSENLIKVSTRLFLDQNYQQCLQVSSSCMPPTTRAMLSVA